MKREITLEERKKIQLDMLEEINDFCFKHKIRYSLAYGTLIGAIRHNGYIPWDDDVDIMMPLPDMLLFKKLFRSEELKFCDVDTEDHYEFPFPRISYQKTYNQIGKSVITYGVNIDIYPVVSLPKDKSFQIFYHKGILLYKVRKFMMKLRAGVISRLPVNTIIGHDFVQKLFRNHLYYNTPEYGQTDTFYVIGGKFEKNEIENCTYCFDIFSNVSSHEFEKHNLIITSRYHDFLSQYYGDYMQLPPEEERHPYHGGHYFWY